MQSKIFSPTQLLQTGREGSFNVVGKMSEELLWDDSHQIKLIVQKARTKAGGLLASFPYGICEVFKTDDRIHLLHDKNFLKENDFLKLLSKFPHLVTNFQNNRSHIGGAVLKRQFFKTISLIDLDLGNSAIVRVLVSTELAKTITVNSFVEFDVGYKENPENIFNNGFDIVVHSIKNMHTSDGSIRKEHLPVGDIRRRFEKRNIDLRGDGKNTLIYRSAVTHAIHEFFQTFGFTQLESPKIVSSGNNGNIASFQMDYYGKPAYLTVNNVMYHVIALGGGMRAIYELGPVFRQDNSKTSKHLTEFSTLDFNAVGFDLNDLITFSNKLLSYVDDRLSEVIDGYTPKIPDIIRAVTYEEYFQFLQKQGLNVSPGDEQKVPEVDPHKMIEEFGSIFWIIHKPARLDAFYNTKNLQSNETMGYEAANNCELYIPGFGTLADGGIRANVAQEVRNNLVDRSFDPGAFKNFLEVYEDGIPSFGGVGFGFDRIIAYFLDVKNTRDTKLVYRDTKSVIF